MNDEGNRPTAIKELEILSSIIARIESTIYQKQGWLLTLITGLALALLKDNPLICKQQFAAITVFITIVFYITDIVQRVPVHRAIKRSTSVEGFYSENKLMMDLRFLKHSDKARSFATFSVSFGKFAFVPLTLQHYL